MSEVGADPAPLLTRHWERALLVAALTAWAVIVLPTVMPPFLRNQADPYALRVLTNQLLLFGIFGIPIALLLSFLAGVVALLVADVLKLWKWWHAPIVGGFAGLLIGLFLTLLMSSSGQLLERFLVLLAVGALSGLAGLVAIGTKAKVR